MPPLESIRTRQHTDVFSVMLVIAAGFLLAAVFLTWLELSDDYDFMGTAGMVAEEEVVEEAAPPAE